MSTLLEQSEANKQFIITSKFLKMWSLRFLKIKRNDETVEVFRHRWDRATVRGLLLLWKNRSDSSPKRRKDFNLKHELKLHKIRLSKRLNHTRLRKNKAAQNGSDEVAL